VNFDAPARCAARVIPAMRTGGRGGSVIFLSSALGLEVSGSGACALEAATGSLRVLVRTLAYWYTRFRVRVNCVCPALVDTDDAERGFPPEVRQDGGAARAAILGRTLIGRGSTAAEVAKAFVYLASDESTSVTGSALSLDGGLTAH
jgi:NAD(P)-dependent dehydrogenase (short-subunit alcohol dehydrogenase family)